MGWNLEYSNVCLFYSLVCVEIFSLSPSYSYIYSGWRNLIFERFNDFCQLLQSMLWCSCVNISVFLC